MTPWQRNAANLAASLDFYGRATDRGAIEDLPGVHLIASGAPLGVLNMALLSTPVAEIEGEFERRISLAAAWFRRRGTPWSFWAGEEWLPRRIARNLTAIFDPFGLYSIAESPGMEVDALPPPARELPVIEVRRVESDAGREDFAHLVSLNFQIPGPYARDIYASPRAWSGGVEGYLGVVDGLPVATTVLVEAAGAAGIYSVGTSPAYRRRGYAEALMRAALGERARGRILLQSSRAGLRLYHHMGFHRVTRFFIYSTV
jgi:ribosomal protein S18 acetylase RimI-like enzyme